MLDMIWAALGHAHHDLHARAQSGAGGLLYTLDVVKREMVRLAALRDALVRFVLHVPAFRVLLLMCVSFPGGSWLLGWTRCVSIAPLEPRRLAAARQCSKHSCMPINRVRG